MSRFTGSARFAGFTLCLLLATPFQPVLPDEPQVRIGVFGLLSPVELLVRPEQGSVIELVAGKESWTLEGSQFATILLDGDAMAVRLPARHEPLVTRRIRLTGRSGSLGRFILSVPGRLERSFRGALDVMAGNGVLVPVISMDMATAVASVLDAELSEGAPLEALKAQAVVARSFYIAHRRRHDRFDFCDTTHCQFLREPPRESSPAQRATESTRGLALSYQGRVVRALYSASCGGRTFTLDEVGMHSEYYPFFAVQCPTGRNRAERWQTSLRGAQAKAILAGTHSEAARIAIGRLMGWKTIPGNNYTVESIGDGIVLHGSGAGHGIGLCQLGAIGMAREGADFRNILRHYFPNTVLAAY